jgi:hypothetical protein
MVTSANLPYSSSHSSPENLTGAMHKARASILVIYSAACRVMLAVCVAMLLAMAPWNAQAQSTFGSIRGTVTDASGAFVPDATVTVHSMDAAAERQATTSSAGEFVFVNLNAGLYKVTVQHVGFADAVVTSVALGARQELRLPVTLTIAAGSTTVQVSADYALMNTENGTLSNSIPSKDLSNCRSIPGQCRAVLWRPWP